VDAADFLLRLGTFYVAYSHMIPISLYVALEVVKLMQAHLIKCDKDMYYKELDKFTNVRSSELVEELGQVEFIFSDKTGTLTCNMMEFKKCSVNGNIYGETITDPVRSLFPNRKKNFSYFMD
jgi:P-type E1-E2 ATPase